MRQEKLYRNYYGTELGQLGLMLLHDVANHVTILQLEIEALQHRRAARDLGTIQNIVKQLEHVVIDTQNRLQGQAQQERFDVRRKVQDAVSSLRYRALEGKAVLDVRSGQPWPHTGDPICLRQVVTVLIESLIDAHSVSRTPFSDRHVAITVRAKEKCIFLTTSNLGKRGEKAVFSGLEHRASYRRAIYSEVFVAAHMLAINCRGSVRAIRRRAESGFVIELPGDDSN